ncbi:ribonuclease HI/retron-type reverse transcriptase [Rhodopseudomonas julia]|uniref:Ribonuclease HI/retron-type reverse transcriptase n=1 Tax=Rhodopseudomonas julia TaxID=200617 RepID=A0ABU0C3T9_9BRAD|nr:RNase H family protein [Rhodopseudomonas julia]MDQ0324606.1 ribonuclease HI/retron-type reverse transcriptase [Rhodopseudomonas julia]
MGKIFDECKKRETLHRAWDRIRANGTRSKADETKRAIEDFARTAERDIQRIQNRLREDTFVFEPQKGVLKKKASGGKRGLVMASVQNRIVERALLDTLSKHSSVAQRANGQPTSFGGVPHRSVPHALQFLDRAFRDGHLFFVRSDISGFFDAVPRKVVIEKIGEDIDDQRFLKLLDQASTVTLGNEEALGDDRSVFPTDEEGVAQGSPLSPLFGNILLHEFDQRFNERGIVCARFIDDFVILGPTEAKVRKAFENAKADLAKLGLHCHDPFAQNADNRKTQRGRVGNGFNFLGYFCSPGLFQPSESARKGLLGTIDQHLTNGRKAIMKARRDENSWADMQRYAQTQTLIDRVLRGWGDAFAYSTLPTIMDRLDVEIDQRLDNFKSWFTRQMRDADRKAKRRMGGVGLLGDVERKTLDEVPFRLEHGTRFRTSKNTITISTDGALCSGARQSKRERRPGGWAFVVHGSNEERGGYDVATFNNRMELMAVIEALKHTPSGASVCIRTDSQYVCSICNEGGAIQKNSDLWRSYEAQASQRRVRIVWVKGHAGDEYNERADRLASKYAEDARLIEQASRTPWVA